jgi:hypothetical protein
MEQFVHFNLDEFIRLHPRTEALETPIEDPKKHPQGNGYYTWNNWEIKVDETRQRC